MPLLKKKVFRPNVIPADLNPDEEVFFCHQTREIFQDYGEFYDRCILLNSLIWTCSATGRPNLTFEEAVESERSALEALESFPESLERPILFFALSTCRSRIDDLVADIWNFLKQRFFKGEIVEVTSNSVKCKAKVKNVVFGSQKASMRNGHVPTAADEPSATYNGEAGKKCVDDFGAAASLYKYELEIDTNRSKEKIIAEPDMISRPRGVLTRIKLKLFLKNACQMTDTQWKVKKERVKANGLDAAQISHFFVGPIPNFAKSPLQRKKASQNALSAASNKKSENKEIKREIEEEARRLASDVADMLHGDASSLLTRRVSCKEEKPSLSSAEIAEMKLRAKEERDRERERVLEERRKQKQVFLDWKRPRDDLLCDDLKILPQFPVLSLASIPTNLIGDCVSVMEFVQAFGDKLNTDELLPNGLSLNGMKDVLITADPQGQFYELVKVLLEVLFNLQEEEDGDEADLGEKSETQDSSELENRLYSAAIREATKQSERIRMIHGVSLRELSVDCYSITEILRLFISIGGYFTGGATSRFRYQQRGGYRCWDDQAFMFKRKEPELFKKLEIMTIFELTAHERIKLLRLLIDQILTYSSFRERIEEFYERLRVLRWDLKQLQLQEAKQEREALASRTKIQQKCEKEQKAGDNENAVDTIDEKSAILSKEKVRVQKLIAAETDRLHKLAVTRGDLSRRATSVRDLDDGAKSSLRDVNFEALSTDEIDQVRSLQKERFLADERSLSSEILDVQQKIGTCLLLGRDRSHRRYYLVRSIPAVLIEEELPEVLGACSDPNGTPLDKVEEFQQYLKPGNEGEVRSYCEINTKALEIRKALLCCSGVMETCAVHGRFGQSVVPAEAKWYWIDSVVMLDELIGGLNSRGFRESELLENLTFARSVLCDSVRSCPLRLLAECEAVDTTSTSFNAEDLRENFELTLREILLEVEEKISIGGLGTLRVSNRDAWREAIDSRKYVCETDAIRLGNEVICRAAECSLRSPVSQLAFALLQIAQGIEPKFLKPPFGDSSKNKPAKQSTTSLDDTAVPDDRRVESINESDNYFEQWQKSLLNVTSLSQIFVHLSTLERNVLWSKSLLHIKCRICRRKGDQNSMVLCAGCDRGYHLFCTKPVLKKPPDEAWFCRECQPKTRKVREKRVVEKPLVNDDIFDDESSSTMDWKQMCAECGGTVIPTKSKADCFTCAAVYHLKCAGLSNQPRQAWNCPECRDEASEVQSEGNENGDSGESSESSSDEAEEQQETSPGGAKRLEDSDSGSEKSCGRTTSRRPSPALAQPSRTSKRNRTPTNSGMIRRHLIATRLASCTQILDRMTHHEDAWPFAKAVSKRDAPDYYEIIRDPIDLRAIERKLSKGAYDSDQLFIADCRRMFENCRVYNTPEAAVYQCGVRLEDFLDSELRKAGLV